MSGSSDPLLLSKKALKVMKGTDGFPGTLLLTATKVKWQADDRDPSKSIAIEIASITKQQQAPGKPMLRILSSAAQPLALSFHCVEDKDEVLEFMKQLRPAGTAGAAPSTVTTAGVPSEAQKRQIFAADKDLATIYTRLVPTGILSESDFWRTRQRDIARLLGGSSTGGGSTGNGAGPRQRTGLSSVMHEVERLHDGTTERVSIHLTPQDVEKIFVERPEVHRAFLAHVPHNFSEAEFWQKYFKLEYKKAARRKRLASQGRIHVAESELEDADDIFAPFRRQLAEQEILANKTRIKSVDPTVNLAAEFADRWSEGFGVAHGGGDVAASGPPPTTGGSGAPGRAGAAGTAATGASTHLDSIARDINRHAAQVLNGAPEGLQSTYQVSGAGGAGGASKPASDSAAIAARVAVAVQNQAVAAAAAAAAGGGTSNAAATATTEGVVSEDTLRDWQERAVSALDDLSLKAKPLHEALKISDPRSYFAAPTASREDTTTSSVIKVEGQHGGAAMPMETRAEDDKRGIDSGGSGKLAAVGKVLLQIDATSLSYPPIKSNLTKSALIESCRGDDQGLVAEFGPVAAAALASEPKQTLTAVMLEFFRMEALKTNEVLRHFWGCMPATTEARRTKAARLATHLEVLKKELSVHCLAHTGGQAGIGGALSPAQAVLVTQMVRPLVEAVEAALRRYGEVSSRG